MSRSNKNQSNLVHLAERAGDEPSHFINRELSSIAFNERVLELAQDPTVPLLERLRYLAISPPTSTNSSRFVWRV